MIRLKDALAEHLDMVEPPPAPLDRVTRRGIRLRWRRRASLTAIIAAPVLFVALVVPRLDDAQEGTDGAHTPTLAAFNISNGLRAFADPDPDGLIHLGDKAFPAKDLSFLDTDAAATPYGVLFFDHGQKPRLLAQDGRIVGLGDGPPAPVQGFHPSSKIDSVNPFVAWTEDHRTFVRVVLYDLSARSQVAVHDVPCTGTACRSVKVDGLDQGMTFVRTATGTYLWHHQDDSWTRFGGPKLRVADVRGRTLLYAGDKPTMSTDAWRFVAAPIDAQLTWDGKNILYWSNVLKPVDGGHTITLSAGSGVGRSWYTIDTDGSVLVATTTDEPSMTDPVLSADVYDCVVPSGQCSRIGAVKTDSGDPMFVGDDM